MSRTSNPERQATTVQVMVGTGMHALRLVRKALHSRWADPPFRPRIAPSAARRTATGVRGPEKLVTPSVRKAHQMEEHHPRWDATQYQSKQHGPHEWPSQNGKRLMEPLWGMLTAGHRSMLTTRHVPSGYLYRRVAQPSLFNAKYRREGRVRSYRAPRVLHHWYSIPLAMSFNTIILRLTYDQHLCWTGL
jgi:hypothetical protein